MVKHSFTSIPTPPGRVLVIALPVLLAACTSLAPPTNGKLKCGTASPLCPKGFECASDQMCWPKGTGPGASIDGAAPTADGAAPANDGATPASDGAAPASDRRSSEASAPDIRSGTEDGAGDVPAMQPDGSSPDFLPQDRDSSPDLATSIDGTAALDQAPATDTAAGPCGKAANGTPCGAGMVCRDSQCVACVAGGTCPVSTTCHKGTWSCSSGNRTCVDDGNAEDGTLCGGGNVCAKGVCTTCLAGGACPVPNSPCRAGVLTCSGGTPVCVDNGPKPDGTSCDDGNACTSGDKCAAGTCAPGTPKTCSALDQCHKVGTCDPATGNCSNPNQAEGTACTDNNACTVGETCHSGVCNGGSSKTCSASDQCHDVGTCDSSTGLCSNPAKSNGSFCNDNNACTQSDTCQAGKCVGANPVVCTALDGCHDVGTCNTSSGVCTSPVKSDGADCNDGNSCTRTDTCQAGSCVGTNPVVCTASDQCHNAGTCNPANGTCSNPAKDDGTHCEDGNLCTTNDTCTAGACRSGAAITCTALDDCHLPGTCDPASGLCSNPNAPNGTSCPYDPDTGTCCDGYCAYNGCR